MRIGIHYDTRYEYEERVGFSRHTLRLIPKAGHMVKIEKFELETNDGARIQYRRDLFDNDVAICFYPEKAHVLAVRLEMQLDIEERDAFAFLLAPDAVNFPFQYREEDRRILAPYLDAGAGLDVPFWTPQPQSTVNFLVGLNEALFKNLQYERRDEGPAREPAETVTLASGACRDFAVLQAAILRREGFAARLASGYLSEIGEENKRAEGALHAWVEVYLPGAGWTGLDPTNGTFCNHNHLTAAVGREPDDVSPILGNYYSDKHVPSRMSSSLQISSL